MLSLPLPQARIHQYLSTARVLVFMGDPDDVEILSLPVNATEEPNGSHHEELEQIRELLVAARDLWQVLPDVAETDLNGAKRTTGRLLQIADLIAVTSA